MFAQQFQSNLGFGSNPRLYVSNMPPNTDEKKLSEIFGKYGKIVDLVHKGNFAFVEFEKAEMADEAIMELTRTTQLRV